MFINKLIRVGRLLLYYSSPISCRLHTELPEALTQCDSPSLSVMEPAGQVEHFREPSDPE